MQQRPRSDEHQHDKATLTLTTGRCPLKTQEQHEHYNSHRRRGEEHKDVKHANTRQTEARQLAGLQYHRREDATTDVGEAKLEHTRRGEEAHIPQDVP
jgi:V8-like Glu-specific endopeptidase